MSITDDLDLLFTDPQEEPKGGPNSVLYFLRREAQDCLIGQVVDESRVLQEFEQHRHRMFATTMVIFAGIDLLGKFAAGNDDNGKVGTRFKDFIMHFGRFDAAAAEILWIARNSIMHSFGLYDKATQKRVLVMYGGHPQPQSVAVFEDHGRWLIWVEALYQTFVGAVERYRQAVMTSPCLRSRFSTMFPLYGSMSYQRPSGG